jgi:hypothetical protein
LKHEFDDIPLSTKTSWKRQRTETVDNTTLRLREHHWEYTIKNYCSCITYKTRDSSRSPTHWIRHRGSGQGEGIFLPPTPNKVFKYRCKTKEADSWRLFVLARSPSTTKSPNDWIFFCSDESAIWFLELQSCTLLSPTETGYHAIPMFLLDVLLIMHILCKIREASFWAISLTLNVYCKVFEDNSGALELARLPKL